MNLSTITAISPIDGRYHEKVKSLRPLFSEFGLIKHRMIVEIRWFEALANLSSLKECSPLNAKTKAWLNNIINQFSTDDAQQVKEIERTTNHDVKAVEYFLKEKFKQNIELKNQSEFIHFGCTSEDINNLSYALMLKSCKETVLSSLHQSLIGKLTVLINSSVNQAMLSHTHGQPASPTTVGKEFANFTARLNKQYQCIENVKLLGKWNGAVGNFNAQSVAYPKLDWPKIAKDFVEHLGLIYNPLTTQIEPHDYLAEIFDAIHRYNTILIDLCRDIWGYISLGYFKQEKNPGEIGSSTMPHKINPIDFENAEGNLGIANTLFHFFSAKLPISRWQRDLSDSTVMRNIGVAFAHSVMAYESILRGLNKISIDSETINDDLNHAWEVLAEPIQTVMRRYGIENPYEQLKSLTRGEKINKKTLHAFVDNLALPKEVIKQLKSLTPENYIGFATKLAKGN